MNQNGERVRGFDVNRLTVIATESYEQFAENLQKEIDADTGIRFGVLEPHQFSAIAVTDEQGHIAPLGVEQSQALWDHLKTAGHVDARGRVQDSLRTALKDGTLVLPPTFEPQRAAISEVLRKVCGRLEVKNADERKAVPLRKGTDGKAVYLSDDFKALWDRIKHQTTYLRSMLLDTKRSIYKHVVYESDPERRFAEALEVNDGVVLYAKLPGWFQVPTPLGPYNPDWAILLNHDGTQRLYFVVETKSSLFTDDLRSKEDAKIECGRAHFAALEAGENPARYMVATSFNDVLDSVT